MPIKRYGVLIVEDDENIIKLLEYNLKRAGFKTTISDNGEGALKEVGRNKPSIIILDIMLPGKSGISVCKQIRSGKDTKDIPIIMLTARSDEVDRISGFQVGADDYVTKPFSPEELILRVKAILNRGRVKDENRVLKAAKVVMDTVKHEVKIKDRILNLTATEFNLLRIFLENKNKLLCREALLSNVWNYSTDIYSRSVDTYIKTLRRKLAKTGVTIVTVRGFGYRLEA